MVVPNSLQRFITAQQTDYKTALSEISSGKKRSHWMWYIFPQIQGLGFSETSRYYAIKDIREAAAYLQHPVLGTRLVTICNALLAIDSHDPARVFGSPDDKKLQSSMTLFAAVEAASPVFEAVLKKFFDGRKDNKTLEIIGIGK